MGCVLSLRRAEEDIPFFGAGVTGSFGHWKNAQEECVPLTTELSLQPCVPVLTDTSCKSILQMPGTDFLSTGVARFREREKMHRLLHAVS